MFATATVGSYDILTPVFRSGSVPPAPPVSPTVRSQYITDCVCTAVCVTVRTRYTRVLLASQKLTEHKILTTDNFIAKELLLLAGPTNTKRRTDDQGDETR